MSHPIYEQRPRFVRDIRTIIAFLGQHDESQARGAQVSGGITDATYSLSYTDPVLTIDASTCDLSLEVRKRDNDNPVLMITNDGEVLQQHGEFTEIADHVNRIAESIRHQVPQLNDQRIICPGCTAVTTVEAIMQRDDPRFAGSCPTCRYENGGEPGRLLTVEEILLEARSDGIYSEVNLGNFLRKVLDAPPPAGTVSTRIQPGAEIAWVSQAAGVAALKHGIVLGFLPKGTEGKEIFERLTAGQGGARVKAQNRSTYERYLVEVPRPSGRGSDYYAPLAGVAETQNPQAISTSRPPRLSIEDLAERLYKYDYELDVRDGQVDLAHWHEASTRTRCDYIERARKQSGILRG